MLRLAAKAPRLRPPLMSNVRRLVFARKPFRPGDYFTVPLEDSTPGPFALGQVLSVEPQALNSCGCAFWPSVAGDHVRQLCTPPIIVTLVTPDLLKSKIWKILGNAAVTVPTRARKYEAFRKSGWVGAKIIGSGIVRSALRAYNGLEYWDDFADPEYVSKLLQPGVGVPSHARFKRDA